MAEEKLNTNTDGSNNGPSEGFLSELNGKILEIKEENKAKAAAEKAETEESTELVDKKDETTDVKVEKKDETAEIKDEKTVETEEDFEYGDEISPNFIEAAKEANWTSEQIIDYANDKSNEELDASIDMLFGEVKEDIKPEVRKEVKEEKKPLISDKVLDEAVKSGNLSQYAVDKIIKPLLAVNDKLQTKMDNLKKGLGTVQRDGAVNAVVNQIKTANEMFDELSKDISVFGRTQDLPRVPNSTKLVPTNPAVKARAEVWDLANKLYNSSDEDGYSFKDALSDSVDVYKSKHLKEKIQDDVVKGIKAKSEQVTARKSRKNATKTYESEMDRKADVVRQAAEKAGVSLE